MWSRLLLIYAVVELAVIFALVSTIGWGATLLILLGTFVLGWGLLAPLAGSQLLAQIRRIRSGATPPRDTLGDGAAVTVATALVLVPGLVTTALGTLLLIPPIRVVAGPAVSALALRGLRRHVPLVNYPARDGRSADGRDYIDGEVIDVKDFDPPVLVREPAADEPLRRRDAF